MTQFENWCEKNGYDPKGEFLDATTGVMVMLKEDDDSENPFFTVVNTGHRTCCTFAAHLSQPIPSATKAQETMTENKLPIPRMVEVRDCVTDNWTTARLLAVVAEDVTDYRYIVGDDDEYPAGWKYMREPEPYPEKPYMTPRQLLDAIQGGAAWRYRRGDHPYFHFDIGVDPSAIEICYDWHGEESDIWEEARVK